jgi:urease beta subunit
MIPGEILLAEDDVMANTGRPTVELVVANTGDRPIQVGSHFHFFEVNKALWFDREQAYGMRLNIPAGTAARFEPGDERKVTLVAFGGSKIVCGHNGFVEGALDDEAIKAKARDRLAQEGFGNNPPPIAA